ncbi:non-specific lipid-transfer protein 1-like isoform X2 [Macadamia integrifolia]|uniref:non-specific lipid-transfer protein 1-like isoform X1 n=1 Tax=Macadamia integrifolia TaxID=60698 RepID=UPI001C4ED46D|nr:non-specific lipid-transfer protein 1-like isoform X1 [Macadamia integrifolia]XP_042503633.1 non-specific lipid-transfer protein 1-like isoform X2 [Macadamia integrifolia]
MANSGVMKLVCLVLACMVVAAPLAEAAITCGQVVSKLAPCLTYLRSGGAVPGTCCNAVKNLNNSAKTTPDRQTACGCLKNAYNSISGINAAYAGGLPAKCGVNLPYKISPSINCATVR